MKMPHLSGLVFRGFSAVDKQNRADRSGSGGPPGQSPPQPLKAENPGGIVAPEVVSDAADNDSPGRIHRRGDGGFPIERREFVHGESSLA